MKNIEIVVFNDKSWVRFTEYQKVKEENEQLKQHNKQLQKNICTVHKNNEKLRQENEQLKAINKKLQCCVNCKHFKGYNEYTDNVYYACELEKCDNLDRWEIAEC